MDNNNDLPYEVIEMATLVAEGYIEDSMRSKNCISKMLAGGSSTSSHGSISEDDIQLTNTESVINAGKLNFTGSFTSCNFYFNNTN